ncbi:MAG: hypothetical protein Q4F39_03305 [Bacteroidia bacterium]|nr:hypothetical protein [Bacteroidia bacterium]
MKRIFLVLALAATLQVANAQNAKSVAAAKSALDKAAAAAENPKQNTKLATWLKYGQALLDAYAAPSGNVWVGMTEQEMTLLGGAEKPGSEEQVVIEGQPMRKLSYSNKNVYVNQAGQVALVEVVSPIIPDALDKALEAYKKANELDASAQKTKEIKDAIQKIGTSYVDEAYNAYTLHKDALASELFEKAFNAVGTAPLSQLDTNTLYNAGFTAFRGQDYARAKEIFTKCVEYNYVGDMGDIYAKLATIAEKEGNAAGAKDYLEAGFSKFPQSQSILVGLINYYIGSGEDTNRLFELLDNAKANEPNNPSLYYVEGNIRKQLGQVDEAAAAYTKCGEIAPEYEYGYVGLGILYYDRAVDIQDKANAELDDKKYQALMADFEKSLKACIEPFEKAYEITASEDTKSGIAEYLKNACFRFREESPEYLEKYNKYSGK